MWLVLGLFLCTAWLLAYKKASASVWAIACLVVLLVISKWSGLSLLSLSLIWIVVFTPLLIINISMLRRRCISKPAMRLMQKVMPHMSRTEREALEAGTVAWEGSLFSGCPDWQEFRSIQAHELTAKEQAFMDGPVNQLCAMTDDWDITHKRLDMPPELWQFIKDHGFFGLIIPENYGGHGFSSTAILKMFARIYSKSITVATTVSVPNSLGPSELLLKYGTQAQKDHYLPRLAQGLDIPCFALTNANAGSDAASIPDIGIICSGSFEGEEIIGIRLNWQKRYITLGPVATLIGLAFRCYDPEKILGDKVDIGISCALIPSTTAGITQGRRHFPLNTAFINGPIQGKDVFIPLDWVIGGKAMLGQGWHQLMECLAAGRAISLPSSALGIAQAASLACTAYARIRKQFNRPIGYFEGIQEPLARIVSNTYIIQATTEFTSALIDQGAEPPVASAIVKYHCTEMARTLTLDAMDIHGGKAICLGPKNYSAHAYQTSPIAITVEGANILTRNLIIFGQGAFRCHPYLFPIVDALDQKCLKTFDKYFFAHMQHIISVASRTLLYALFNGRFSHTPKSVMKRYYQLINRYSASFAFAAEIAMITIGGALKRKENVSARLGDALSGLYLASAVLKRFENEGEREEDIALVVYSLRVLLRNVEYTLHELIRNFPVRGIRRVFRWFMFPFGRRCKLPRDTLSHRVATQMLEPCSIRDRLTRDVYQIADEHTPLAFLNEALSLVFAAEPYEKAVQDYSKEQRLDSYLQDCAALALQAGVIDAAQLAIIRKAEAARQDIIAVDDFAADSLAR